MALAHKLTTRRRKRNSSFPAVRCPAVQPGHDPTEIGVDVENRILRGVVMAQAGPFLEPRPRGQFDRQSLIRLRDLVRAKPNGELKSRVSHPGFADDGFLRFVGVFRQPWLSTAIRVDPSGSRAEVQALRGNLHIAESAGEVGSTVLSRAKQHPHTFAASFVLTAEEEFLLDSRGRPRLGDDGQPLPPVWRPTSVVACDLVEDGAAVSTVFGLATKPVDTPEELLEWLHEQEVDEIDAICERIEQDLDLVEV